MLPYRGRVEAALVYGDEWMEAEALPGAPGAEVGRQIGGEEPARGEGGGDFGQGGDEAAQDTPAACGDVDIGTVDIDARCGRGRGHPEGQLRDEEGAEAAESLPLRLGDQDERFGVCQALDHVASLRRVEVGRLVGEDRR